METLKSSFEDWDHSGFGEECTWCREKQQTEYVFTNRAFHSATRQTGLKLNEPFTVRQGNRNVN